jgi:hypothetical protein
MMAFLAARRCCYLRVAVAPQMRGMLASYASSSSRSPPTPPTLEAESVSIDEFERSSAANTLSRGQMGSSAEAMHDFWSIRGLDDALSAKLALKAEADGGVWADPATLSARIKATVKMLAPMPLERLVRRCPEALQSRPETAVRKLETLTRCLPGVDVIKMVGLDPTLLKRSPEALQARVQLVMAALPRPDMAHVIARQPILLRIAPEELAARSRAIRAAYVASTIAGWDPSRAGRMLCTKATVLSRLALVDSIHPGVRVATRDKKLLRMREDEFHTRFEHKQRSKWGKKRVTAAAQLPPRSRSPFGDEAVPQRGNMLVWGQQRMLERRKEAEAEAAQLEVTTSSAAAARSRRR